MLTIARYVAIVLVIAVCNVPHQADAAPVSLPATPAGDRVHAFLQAFNSGVDAQMTTFTQANFTAASLAARPAGDRIAMYRRMRSDMAEITPARVLVAADDHIDLLVQTGSGEYFEFDFHFDVAPQRLIASLGVKSSTADAEPPAAPKRGADLIAAIGAYLDGLTKADRFSGAVLLAHDDDVLFQKAYGFASKAYRVPNTTATRFNLGSINKLMTRIAIEQLVEQKKLAYDQTLVNVLPDYPGPAAARQITVRQLIDMTSGIGDMFGPEFDRAPKDRVRSLSDYVPFFAAKPLAFAPGTGHVYSNGGYIVLGLIVEKVSGQSYYDYVAEHIFKPAGMSGSAWFERDVPMTDIATGYTKHAGDADSSDWRDNIFMGPARGSSAGGGYSTLADLLAFARALEAGKLVAKIATRDIVGGGIGVAGGAEGINAALEIDPASGYVLVVLSNYDPPAAENAARVIRGWLGLD